MQDKLNSLVESFRIIRRNKRAFAGLIMLVIFLLMALIGPVLIKLDLTPDYINRFQPPSLRHILGTDYAGRDIFTLLVHGSRGYYAHRLFYGAFRYSACHIHRDCCRSDRRSV